MEAVSSGEIMALLFANGFLMSVLGPVMPVAVIGAASYFTLVGGI